MARHWCHGECVLCVYSTDLGFSIQNLVLAVNLLVCVFIKKNGSLVYNILIHYIFSHYNVTLDKGVFVKSIDFR